MGKIFLMGTFSAQGVKGLLTSDNDREAIVKATCEAIGAKFQSYDILQGKFDFIAIVEGNPEQAIAMKGVVTMSGDFDEIVVCNSVSLEAIRSNVKNIMTAYKPPSG